MEKLKNLSVLLSGQLITSRTETIEEFLKDKVKYLGVIGIASPYIDKGLGRSSLYEDGKLIKQSYFPGIRLKGPNWLTQPLLFFVFSVYFVFMVIAALRFKRKFDCFIGVACFSALFGLFLKKIGIVRNLIYYTIDYYPLPKKFCFNTLINRAIWTLDKICVKASSIVWNISPRIIEAREQFMRFSRDNYKHVIAPMAYGLRFLKAKAFNEIERWTIGFVGSLSWNQGLQLLIQSMPEIIKQIPQIKVCIIGTGLAENELKNLVKENNLREYFIFHGFIKDENEVLDILSRCAIGIAPWVSSSDDNVLYADPGKPKLYAFCGLPVIITNGTLVAKEISDRKAGISINYDKEELVQAVFTLLNNAEKLREYKGNAGKFALDYSSETIFGPILQESIENIKL